MSPNPRFQSIIDGFNRQLNSSQLVSQTGQVSELRGLVIEADGPGVAVGDICAIYPQNGNNPCHAEVVGFHNHRILLMPLEDIRGIQPGCRVIPAPLWTRVPCGDGLKGRILDGLGRPIDEGALPPCADTHNLHRSPPHPLKRQRIRDPFVSGVRAIDLFTPIGRGQRIGLFAGTGVGKTTLLGMLARNSEADVNVVALVGERGREIRELVEKDFGAEGLAKSVIIVATSDSPALVRLRAAFLATAIAEWFRDQGKNVLFMMDSVTRFAMAQREIGLSVGEPPATRGYPPSVFALLPKLLERTGSGEKGTITAFYTVLVEGDDMNEPIADAIRGILDGHIVLSRAHANANRFPAVDVLDSISRLTRDICSDKELDLLSKARDSLALYRKNEDLITIGAYAKNSNPKLDRAIELHERIENLLRQSVHENSSREEAFEQLKKALA